MQTNKTTWYYQKMSAICLTIIAAGVITAILIYTRALMIPLVIAIFFYTILVQIATLLHKKFSGLVGCNRIRIIICALFCRRNLFYS